MPDDISVVGIDDIALSTKVWPNLTTMRQPITAIGYRAAYKLIRKLQGLPDEGPSSPDADLLTCELIVRDSAREPGRH